MKRKVSSFNGRDEMKIDRLSSFLFHEGNLEIVHAIPIKANVFFIKTSSGSKLILKKHSKRAVVEQQWNFFDTIRSSIVVPFRRFPNGKKLLISNGFYWTISPYMEGEKLHYGLKDDRKVGLLALRQFHAKAKEIYVPHPIKRTLFYERWYNRLQSFKETGHFFSNYGFVNLYKDIVQTTEIQLNLVSKLPWTKLEQRAEKEWVWIHGDVASHNFIQNRNVYMIDFDLLARSPQVYDYIQLAQRFLPFLDWDLDALLSYRMVHDNQVKPWILATTVPSDVLREWLHFLSRNPNDSIYHYLTTMQNEWTKRQDFLKNVKSMLKLVY